MIVKGTETERTAFVNGVLAAAQSRGVTEAEIKRECFGSYATGNRRIEHNCGELNLKELSNIATKCKMTLFELFSTALYLQGKGDKK